MFDWFKKGEPMTDAERFQQKGLDLVVRLGTEAERQAALQRREEIASWSQERLMEVMERKP